MTSIKQHIENMIVNYSRDEFYNDFREAQKEYAQMTGKFDDDNPEFEGRMSSFNDWYLFNFRRESDDKRVIDLYIKDADLRKSLVKALYNTTYSVFYYGKETSKKNVILTDIYNDEEIPLEVSGNDLGIVKNDLFVGRVIRYKNEGTLLQGMCFLPNIILSHIKKELKKHRLLSPQREEELFLYLESLKVKSMHYSHVAPEQIFQLNSF
jgi:hypothetical protein